MPALGNREGWVFLPGNPGVLFWARHEVLIHEAEAVSRCLSGQGRFALALRNCAVAPMTSTASMVSKADIMKTSDDQRNSVMMQTGQSVRVGLSMTNDILARKS